MCIRDRYKSLGVYLPLITTNGAVLGVAIQKVTKFGGTEMSFLKSIIYGTSAAIGFTVAIVLFAGVRAVSYTHLLQGA